MYLCLKFTYYKKNLLFNSNNRSNMPPSDKMIKDVKSIKPEDIWTAPFDPRFPNQNQTRYCYQSYLDFHRCSKARGENDEACQYFKNCYLTLCPKSWHEKWDEQIRENRFPGNI